MKVSVLLPNCNSFTFEMNPRSTLLDLKHLAEEKSGLEAKDMILTHNEVCLTNDESILEDLGIKDGHIVTAHKQGNEADGNEKMKSKRTSQTASIQVSPILLQEQTGFTKKCQDNITAPRKQTRFRDTNEVTRHKKQTSAIGNIWKDGVHRLFSSLWPQSTIRVYRGTDCNERHPLENTTGQQLGCPRDQDVYTMNDCYSGRHYRASMNGRNFHNTVDSSSFRQGHLYVVAPAGHSKKQYSDHQFKDPGYVRELLLSTPDQLALVRQNNPQLAEALDTNRLDMFSLAFKNQLARRERLKKQQTKLLNSHPYDEKAQLLIAEDIRQRNVEANMEAAIEYNPEAFGSVVMLYINCKVNGHPVKAFVDSGAQTTIMSTTCAERCNVMRLVDTRWEGIAKGVGTQRIIGRIHLVQVAIEKDFLTTSLSILNEQPMDMLLGLDMLRRHQCTIDLRRNVLKIGTTGTMTKFLAERDLPACARLTSGSDDEEDYHMS